MKSCESLGLSDSVIVAAVHKTEREAPALVDLPFNRRRQIIGEGRKRQCYIMIML